MNHSSPRKSSMKDAREVVKIAQGAALSATIPIDTALAPSISPRSSVHIKVQTPRKSINQNQSASLPAIGIALPGDGIEQGQKNFTNERSRSLSAAHSNSNITSAALHALSTDVGPTSNPGIASNKPPTRILGQKKDARRKTFDENAWNSIQKLKGKDKTIVQAALTNLRSGNADFKFDPFKESENQARKELESKQSRRRRWTFTEQLPDGGQVFGRDRGVMFGNRALEFDTIQMELNSLQDEVLSEFKNIIGCEAATILFLNEPTRELMFFVDHRWLRVPVDNSIAGACVMSGDTVHISDAYSDSRFNRDVDKLTNFHTRDILCEPVRLRNGGGPVIAVVEMINKNSTEGFDSQDIVVLKACVSKVADSLGSRFKELTDAASLMYSNSELPGEVGVNPNHRFDDPTTASKMAHVRDVSKLTLQEQIARNDFAGPRGESTGPVIKVDRSLDVLEEKRRRQRRLSYKGATDSAPSSIPSKEAQATSDEAIKRVDSDERPRWVGKTAKIVGELEPQPSA